MLRGMFSEIRERLEAGYTLPAGWYSDSAILALPLVIRCKEDCAGLCAQCGADRNRVECGCEPPSDARWEALRGLL